jgi:DNA primase
LIALHQYGIKNTAASLGTAFTPEQSKLLGRFTKRIVINYDGDKAGVKAARRAIETLVKDDFETKVLILPDGNDPDDFLKANGAESYNHLRGNAFSFMQFVLDNLMLERNLASTKERSEAIEDLLPLLSFIRNPLQKREAFDQAMSFLRIDDKILKDLLLKKVKHPIFTQDLSKENDKSSDEIERLLRKRLGVRMTIAEQRLLELLIYDKDLREIILPQLEETDYETLATAEVFRALLALKEIGSDVTGENLLELVQDDAAASDYVSVLLMSEPARDLDEAIDGVLSRAESHLIALRKMAINEKILEVSQNMFFAEQTGNLDLLSQLVMQQIELEKIKRSLDKKISEN